MGFSGGDGGAAAAEAAEAQRKQKRDAGVQRINQLFGITEAPRPAREQFVLAAPQAQFGPHKGQPSGDYRGPHKGQPQPHKGQPQPRPARMAFDDAAYQAAVAAWQAGVGANNRGAVYDRVRQGVRDFFGAQLTEQQEEARQALTAQLIRQGLIGGSVQLEQGARLREREDDALAAIATKAERAALAARSADEQARMEAIQAINADVNQDAVVRHAANRLAMSGDQALADARSQYLDDFFAGLALIQRGRDAVDQTGRAMRDYERLYGGPGRLAPAYMGRRT